MIHRRCRWSSSSSPSFGNFVVDFSRVCVIVFLVSRSFVQSFFFWGIDRRLMLAFIQLHCQFSSGHAVSCHLPTFLNWFSRLSQTVRFQSLVFVLFSLSPTHTVGCSKRKNTRNSKVQEIYIIMLFEVIYDWCRRVIFAVRILPFKHIISARACRRLKYAVGTCVACDRLSTSGSFAIS